MTKLKLTALAAAALAACAGAKADTKPTDDNAPPATAANGERLKIAVKPIRPKGVDPTGTSVIEVELCQELFKQHADAVCPDDLKAIIQVKQAQLELGGCDNDDAACTQKIANVANANRVLAGEIGKLDDQIVLTLSMLDAGNATVVGRASAKVSSLGDLSAKLPGMVKQLLK